MRNREYVKEEKKTQISTISLSHHTYSVYD